jgi:hypothetical protein
MKSDDSTPQNGRNNGRFTPGNPGGPGRPRSLDTITARLDESHTTLIAAMRDYRNSTIDRGELLAAASVARRVLLDAERFFDTIEK